MVVPVISMDGSYGITFPKLVLEKLRVKDKVNMKITDDGILLTPVNAPRAGWSEAFCKMHENKDDVLDDIPSSEALEWEW